MFRRLILVIFGLYMKYLLSSYTKHTRAVNISYFIEHNGDDEPRDYSKVSHSNILNI